MTHLFEKYTFIEKVNDCHFKFLNPPEFLIDKRFPYFHNRTSSDFSLILLDQEWFFNWGNSKIKLDNKYDFLWCCNYILENSSVNIYKSSNLEYTVFAKTLFYNIGKFRFSKNRIKNIIEYMEDFYGNKIIIYKIHFTRYTREFIIKYQYPKINLKRYEK